jgi:hypothetical protein
VTDVRALAIRFADLWAVDHHQMVDEIYAPTIHMESMARLERPPIEGAEELHGLEDRLAEMIPRHRHELVRVIPGDRVSCLETMVVGPTTAEYAPACVWWWVDARGQVGHEVGWFDWEVRSTDSHLSHGLVPRNDHGRRGDEGWYGTFAGALAEGLVADPRATLSRLLAPGCVVEDVGCGPGADLAMAVSGVDRIEVHEVAGDGAVVAILFTARDHERVSRGTFVLTLDGDNRATSFRAYWRWTSAVRADAVHPSLHLALPGSLH